eukprot:2170302-Pyramimonas_sp.AAC.1
MEAVSDLSLDALGEPAEMVLFEVATVHPRRAVPRGALLTAPGVSSEAARHGGAVTDVKPARPQ